MAIQLIDMERLEKHPGNASLLLPVLQLVSLDACVPYHLSMRVPQHFGEPQRLLLQRELHEYQLPVGATRGFKNAWVVRVLQAYEASFGLGNTELLIEWMSHCGSVPAFGSDLIYLIWDVMKGKITADVPPRMQRFESLYELMTEADDDVLDAALLPENLSSAWDKRCWASNHWPEEDDNTWNPSIWAWSYINGSGGYLAWENACRNPRITQQELDAIDAWVRQYSTNVHAATLPRPETMFLPARLRAEYEEGGLIAPERGD